MKGSLPSVVLSGFVYETKALANGSSMLAEAMSAKKSSMFVNLSPA